MLMMFPTQSELCTREKGRRAVSDPDLIFMRWSRVGRLGMERLKDGLHPGYSHRETSGLVKERFNQKSQEGRSVL